MITMGNEPLSALELQALIDTEASHGLPDDLSEANKKLLALGYLRANAGIISITKAGKVRLANERSLQQFNSRASQAS